MQRKFSYILARLAGLLILSALSIMLIIQIPAVQTKLGASILSIMTSSLDAEITYDDISVSTTGALLLRNIVIKDLNPYTEDRFHRGWESDSVLFKADKITATLSLRGLKKGDGINIGHIVVDNGYLHIITEPDSIYRSNIQRMLQAPEPPDTIRSPGPDLFTIRRASIRNFRFRLTSFLPPVAVTKESGIDFEDLDLLTDIEGRKISMSGGIMRGMSEYCHIKEKSGYEVFNIKGACAAGQGKVVVDDISITDPWSDVRFKNITMSFDSPRAFIRFVDEVTFDSEFDRTRIAMKTINYFAGGSLQDNPIVFDITSGHIHGPISALDIRGLRFCDLHSGVSGTVGASLTGLPDVNMFAIGGDVRRFRFNTAQLSAFLSSWSSGQEVDFKAIAPGTVFTLDAQTRGLLNEMQVSGQLSSDAGSAAIGSVLHNIAGIEGKKYIEATTDIVDADIKEITGIEALGKGTMFARATLLLKDPGVDITVDSLSVSSLELVGYNYSRIHASGELVDDTASAQIDCNDPNLKFTLAALADLKPWDGNSRYKLAWDIADADLHALNLDKRGDVSRISLGLFANFIQTGDKLRGEGRISNVKLENDGAARKLDDVTLLAFQSGENQAFRLLSPFADADMAVSKPLRNMFADLKRITVGKELPAVQFGPTDSLDCGSYKLALNMHDSRDLLAYVMPGLYIADSTRLNIDIRREGTIDGRLHSPLLAFETRYIEDAGIEFNNSDSSLNALISGSSLHFGDLRTDNPYVSLKADNDRTVAKISFDNFGVTESHARFEIHSEFLRDAADSLLIVSRPDSSFFSIGSKRWEVTADDITFRKGHIDLSRFRIGNESDGIVFNGGTGRNSQDTLSIVTDKFDLSILDAIFQKPYDFRGLLRGQATIISSGESSSALLAGFNVDSLSIGGVNGGDILMSSSLDESGTLLNMSLTNRINGHTAVDAAGVYSLVDKSIDMNARLDDLALGIAAPFMTSLFSEMGGGLSGSISVRGNLSELELSSRQITLNNAMVRPALTGVPYSVSGPLEINNNGAFFNSLTVHDGASGNGILSGEIRYTNLKDFAFDARLDLNNMKIVDARENEGSSFYGNVLASGSAQISGPLESMVLDANITTTGNGDIHIPLSGSMTGDSAHLLTFTEASVYNPYMDMLSQYLAKEEKKTSDVTIHARLTLTPGLTAYAEIDKSVGNVASFNGNGALSLSMRPAKDQFSLSGDYNINEGNYHFVLPGVLDKDFTITNGSSVKFGGEIQDTQLDIKAIHSLKTSLASLITDSTAVSSRRLVECGLAISDRLRSPKIDFSIDVPDLDPISKAQVSSALNTEDKIQKQFVALLLMGAFLPSESSGVFNGSNMLYSNFSQVVSSQINSIFKKLEIPVDLGFGYQQNTGGTDIFDLALSTQIFNNRVVVGGTVGNRKYKTSKAGGDMVGDLDIEIKLNDPGELRLNLFSHSADEFTNFLDHSQRNGIGISYQKEYTRFRDFIRGLFASGKKREQLELEAIENEMNKEMVTINIEEEYNGEN